MLFFTILLIGILSGVEVDLFIPSFPELQHVFQLSPVMVQLTLSVNFVAYCACCLFVGALGDRFDRRKVMLISLIIFVIGSVLCVYAQNFTHLLAGRFLQGVGMAGPSTLGFAIIADLYPASKQPSLMAVLNGLTTAGMAFAPVIGSYVNLYFDWRGNFVLLLTLGVICFLAAYRYVPHRVGDPTISLSPKAYWPLLCSGKLMSLVLAFNCIANAYWVFVGMAPIVFIEAFSIPLSHYGYYLGALAGVFSIVSLISGRILYYFGHKRCLYAGIGGLMLSFLAILLLVIFDVRQAWLITTTLLLFSISAVFPINILYPMALNVLPNTKGRTTALFMAVRLMLTAIALEVASYFYSVSFISTGITMLVFLGLSLYFIWELHRRKWLILAK